jgi:hypothetical protein
MLTLRYKFNPESKFFEANKGTKKGGISFSGIKKAVLNMGLFRTAFLYTCLFFY